MLNSTTTLPRSFREGGEGGGSTCTSERNNVIINDVIEPHPQTFDHTCIRGLLLFTNILRVKEAYVLS